MHSKIINGIRVFISVYASCLLIYVIEFEMLCTTSKIRDRPLSDENDVGDEQMISGVRRSQNLLIFVL